MEAISPKAAKEAGLKTYFTGKPCKNGHVAKRLVSNSTCLSCSNERVATWAANNPGKRQAIVKRWYSATADQRRALARDRHRRDPETRHRYKRESRKRHPESARVYYEKNKASILVKDRQRRRSNPGPYRERVRRRQAAKLRATPAWLTKNDISEMTLVYSRAAALGPGWHVDHIVPLQGQNVCGLHVPWNLQVLPAPVNVRKSNKL